MFTPILVHLCVYFYATFTNNTYLLLVDVGL